MEVDEHEWELSKENVQPLRQGRQMSSLSAALHSDPDDERSIKEQQNKFETELRHYEGDDPFDVWDRYIKWTEQYFPKGGHDGHLMKLIERCLKQFIQDKKYTNDHRFVKVWGKFAQLSKDPLEVYAYMFDNGIGSKVALLYTDWAVTLERMGDNKTADAIYTEGLNRRAEPLELLQQRHQQFQSRVARNITLQIAEGQVHEEEMESSDKRMVLGKLKATGSSHKVATSRTGSSKLGSAGRLKDSRPMVPKQVPSQGFSVFTDQENANPCFQPQQTFEWKSMPSRAVDNRENDKKPGVWTDAKVPQKRGTASSALGLASFEIHEDPDSQSLPNVTPRKTTLINTQPLSSRKATHNPDVLSKLRQMQGVPNLNEGVPMYQKHMIYNGLCEFSFEELRASKYWKKKKEKDLEKTIQEQAKRIAAMETWMRNFGNLSLERELQSGLQERDNLLSQSAGAQPESGAGVRVLADCETESASSTVSTTSVKSVDRAVDNSNKDITPTNIFAYPQLKSGSGSSESRQNSSSSRSQRTPIFNSLSGLKAKPSSASSCTSASGGSNSSHLGPSNTSHNSSAISGTAQDGDVLPPYTNSSSGSSSSGVTSKCVGSLEENSICDSEAASGNRFSTSSAGPTPESTNSFNLKRGSLSAPSPTVCTREALQVVMGMFSTSLEARDESQCLSETNSFAAIPQAKNVVPFQICEDPTNHDMKSAPNSPQVQKAGGGFGLQIHQDEDMDQGPDMNPVPIFRAPESSKQTRQPLSSIKLRERKDEKNPTDVYMDKEMLESDSSKKTARRGLCFVNAPPATGPELEKESLPNDFTIECQARDDITLAPLDGFHVHALAASTPFTGNQSKSQLLPQDVSENNTVPCSNSAVSTYNTCTQDLSPILEGSEGTSSGEETKSLAHKTNGTHSNLCPNVSIRSRHGSSGIGKMSINVVPEEVEEEEEEAALKLDQDNVQDASMTDDSPLEASRHPLIDTSAYVPEYNEKTEALLGTSICLDTKDPFDEKTIAQFLAALKPPLQEFPGYSYLPFPMPELSESIFVEMGDVCVSVEKLIGEGGYAKIFQVLFHDMNADDENTLTLSAVQKNSVIKVQTPPCYWEFYVSSELHRRLSHLRTGMDVRPAVMKIERSFFFENGSVLQMPFAEDGTLLDLVNKYKGSSELMSRAEPFACLLTIELLHLFELIHRCGFIHGDVKPDNFLLLKLQTVPNSKNPAEVFGSSLRLVQLIDFGQSIDMTMFPKGTTFTAKVVTSGFQCIEMKTDNPWTFQTDLFGLVATIHVVLFGSYMKVFQEKGEWRTTGNFIRKWNVRLWKKLFKELLNVPSCDEMPDLASLRAEFESHFLQNLISGYNTWLNEINIMDVRAQ